MPRCATCHYDLRSLRTTRCPECGQLLTAAALASARERSLFRRLCRVTAIAIVVGVVIGVPLLAIFAEQIASNVEIVLPLTLLAVGPITPVIVAAYASRWLDSP